MVRCSMVLCLVLGSLGQLGAQESAPVYSGPQPGETLTSFQLTTIGQDRERQPIDLVAQAADGPLVLVFVHNRTRPAFGLANAIMKYCREQAPSGLKAGLCFLTADPTETENWMARVARNFPSGVPIGYSPDGAEGPGALGLNRNVEVTVLTAKEGKIVANFALVQPGAHADGPRILKAIAEMVGETEQPDINRYLPNNQSLQDAPIAIDPRLQKHIRVLNRQGTSEDEAQAAIEAIEQLVADNRPLQGQLGPIAVRWVRSGRIDGIGSEAQQTTIRQWARQFGAASQRMQRDRPRGDAQLTTLLRELIQKDRSDEQVAAARKAIEDYVADHPEAKRELNRIATTVVNSDKLENYGTAAAQEALKSWARQEPDQQQD